MPEVGPEIVPEKPLGARFAGMTALVTGAAGGIGLAVARRLAAEGCRVTLTDIDRARLQAATAALAENGAAVAAVAADLSVAEQRDRLVPAVVERWGRIDVLVNNAADHGSRTPFRSASGAEWEKVFATNVTAAAELCRLAARDMLARRRGAIVNMASIQAQLPVPSYAAYVSSKGAILAMTRALAVELSPAGIRVNAVAPGVIGTESFHAALASGDKEAPASAALLGRHGRPDEVAAAVAFLASGDASFVTGTTLVVDGGRCVSRRTDPFETAFGGQAVDGTP